MPSIQVRVSSPLNLYMQLFAGSTDPVDSGTVLEVVFLRTLFIVNLVVNFPGLFLLNYFMLFLLAVLGEEDVSGDFRM